MDRPGAPLASGGSFVLGVEFALRFGDLGEGHGNTLRRTWDYGEQVVDDEQERDYESGLGRSGLIVDQLPLAPGSLEEIGNTMNGFFGQLSLAFRAILDVEEAWISSHDSVAQTETVHFAHEHGQEGALATQVSHGQS